MDSIKPSQDFSALKKRVLDLIRNGRIRESDYELYARILFGSGDVVFILHADKLNVGNCYIQSIETNPIIVDELYEMEFGKVDGFRVIQSNLKDIIAFNTPKLGLQKIPKKSMPYYHGKRRF